MNNIMNLYRDTPLNSIINYLVILIFFFPISTIFSMTNIFMIIFLIPMVLVSWVFIILIIIFKLSKKYDSVYLLSLLYFLLVLLCVVSSANYLLSIFFISPIGLPLVSIIILTVGLLIMALIGFVIFLLSQEINRKIKK